MTASLALALVPLALAAGPALTLDAGVRTEGRLQARHPIGAEGATGVALEVEPRAALEASAGALRLELSWVPRFTHAGGDGAGRDTWLHRAGAAARWRPDPRWRLEATFAATAGTLDLFRAAPSGEPPPAAQPAPVAATLSYRQYEAALTADARLASRLALLGRLQAWREAGGDAAALETVPLQQGARLRLELAWRVARGATLTGALSTSATRFTDVPVAAATPADPAHASWTTWQERLEATCRQVLSRQARGWATAGLVLAGGDGPGQDATWRPAGELGVAAEGGPRWSRFSGGAVAGLSPLEDRRTGLTALRADLRAWLAWAPSRRWSLAATGSAARVLEGPERDGRFASGELRLTARLAEPVAFAVGARGTAQWEPRVQDRPGTEWAGFASVEVGWRGRP